MPRPRLLTGDLGEGEAQVAPPGSPIHRERCALQTPGAGIPGEDEPPAVRGGGGTRAVLGAGSAAEGQTGGGPAAPAGGGNRPAGEADPGPEGRGVQGAAGCLLRAPQLKRGRPHCPKVPSSHPPLPEPGLNPPHGPMGLTLKNVFCNHRGSPLLSLSGNVLASPGESRPSLQPCGLQDGGPGVLGSESGDAASAAPLGPEHLTKDKSITHPSPGYVTWIGGTLWGCGERP